MTDRCLYSQFQYSKTGDEVAVFFNSHWMFSKYNPLRDIDLLSSKIGDSKQLILFGGIGSGQHIKKMLKKKSISLIIAVEENDSSLNFCKERLNINSDKLILCTIKNLKSILKQNYNPILHGDFTFLPVQTWLENIADKSKLFEIIDSTIKDISADISTQTFFGKIWHFNILKNLQTLNEIQSKISNTPQIIFDTNLTVAIVGAGPTLDNDISKLKKNLKNYYIIATDTALRVLEKNNITPNCLVTLDGQSFSSSHFIGAITKISCFVFDLCSNPNVVKLFANICETIIPVTSGHPLVSLYSNWLQQHNKKDFITSLTAGNGTVLQLALDFATNAGFQDFHFFGADFAFKNHKPYAKGTYLEDNYLIHSNMLNSFEMQNTNLMYRSSLIKSEDCFTNQLLQSYKFFFTEYLEKNKTRITIYNIKMNNNAQVCFYDFISWYLEKLKENDKKVLFSLLPLAAWINNNQKDSDTYRVALFFTRRFEK